MEEKCINVGLDERIKKLNPKKEPLTKEKLRTFKGYENLSDEEISEVLFSIQSFSNILYEYLRAEGNENNNNENQIKIAA